jgi:methyl-accepting chemotaxis protein
MPAPVPFPLLSVALVQAAWVGPTMAVSLVVIALAFVVIALAVAVAGRGAAGAMHKVSKEIGGLRSELEPTLRELREAAQAGRGVATTIKTEADEIVRTSRQVRADLDRGLRRAKRRLSDLDALAEVMQEEVEETALDVASRVRSFRTGTSVIGRLRRLLLRGRR